MAKVIDLTGKRFGRWTVIRKYGRNPKGKIMWLCKCDCGTAKIVRGTALTTGATQSCGCLAKELVRERMTIHGQCYSRLYRIWQDMKNRCENLKDIKYHEYGGKGITVCGEWHDFSCFFQWAMGNGYYDSLSIDRIDGKKGYYPSNCRWATIIEQNNNKRNNRIISYCGKSQTMAMWCHEIGMPESTLGSRLSRGWSIQRALTEPISRKAKVGGWRNETGKKFKEAI